MIAYAAALILVATSGDYALVLSTGEEVCAKSADTCQAAIRAIERGWWPILPPGSGIRCEPRPQGCFSYESNTIRGFNR